MKVSECKEYNIKRHFKTHEKQIQIWNFQNDHERHLKYEQLKQDLFPGHDPSTPTTSTPAATGSVSINNE